MQVEGRGPGLQGVSRAETCGLQDESCMGQGVWAGASTEAQGQRPGTYSVAQKCKVSETSKSRPGLLGHYDNKLVRVGGCAVFCVPVVG